MPVGLRAFVRSADGDIRPFEVSFGDPVITPSDSYVSVATTESPEGPFKIYGQDPVQAVALSRAFVKSLLNHSELVICDEAGNPIELLEMDDRL